MQESNTHFLIKDSYEEELREKL